LEFLLGEHPRVAQLSKALEAVDDVQEVYTTAVLAAP